MPWMLLFATLLAPVPQKSGKELTLDMHERFAYATMMRTALIHGYLERVRRHAAQLSELLAGTESEDLAAVAREAAEATDIGSAAAAVARVGEACGSCHAENKVQPIILGQVRRRDGKTLVERMGRHMWSADLMWQGLISHSVLPWQEGARALAKAPLFKAGPDMGVSQSRLDEISALATEALKPQSWKSRAEVYGRFLAACSDCHRSYAN